MFRFISSSHRHRHPCPKTRRADPMHKERNERDWARLCKGRARRDMPCISIWIFQLCGIWRRLWAVCEGICRSICLSIVDMQKFAPPTGSLAKTTKFVVLNDVEVDLVGPAARMKCVRRLFANPSSSVEAEDDLRCILPILSGVSAG